MNCYIVFYLCSLFPALSVITYKRLREPEITQSYKIIGNITIKED